MYSFLFFMYYSCWWSNIITNTVISSINRLRSGPGNIFLILATDILLAFAAFSMHLSSKIAANVPSPLPESLSVSVL